MKLHCQFQLLLKILTFQVRIVSKRKVLARMMRWRDDMRTRMNDGELSTQHLHMTNLQNVALFLYRWECEFINFRKITLKERYFYPWFLTFVNFFEGKSRWKAQGSFVFSLFIYKWDAVNPPDVLCLRTIILTFMSRKLYFWLWQFFDNIWKSGLVNCINFENFTVKF